MGCDIHIWAERKVATGYEVVTDAKFSHGPAPFDWRAYWMFGFLAGVRNYSGIPPLAEPRGIPSNVSQDVADDYEMWDADAHSASWLSVEELMAFDYTAPVEDLRVTVQTSWGLDGGGTAAPGGGKMTTYQDFLGDAFLSDLKVLADIGADRIVFWFDN